jgi:transketolase
MKISPEKRAREIRKRIIQMHRRGPSVGSSLSAVDILTVLYFEVMDIKTSDDPERDRFILSKGHAASALYATLAEKGFIRDEILEDYLKDGSILYGHPVKGSLPGIEASTGSLGHGLPIAIGIAWAAKNDNKKFKVYVLVGDGECQEGSIWEAANLATRLKLDNLVVIIDANNLQGYERVDNIQSINTFKSKWQAFGWVTREVNGHNISELKDVLKNIPFDKGKPSLIVARTVKGKGIREMENKLEWHYFSVPEDKVKLFIDELENR